MHKTDLRLALLLLALAAAPLAQADSNRCFGAAVVANEFTTPTDLATIDSYWRDVGGTTSPRSDGPLGCPLGEPRIVGDNVAGFYLGQEFQRGWVLIGRESAPPAYPWPTGPTPTPSRSGVSVVFVRSLGQWWVWSRGFPAEIFPAIGWLPPDAVTSRHESPLGGIVQTTSLTGLGDSHSHVALYTCVAIRQTGGPPPAIQSGHLIPGWHCHQWTPAVNSRGGPMEFAARLTPGELANPDVNGRASRAAAAFPEWMPCFARSPRLDEFGEDTIALTAVMMYRQTPCPVTPGRESPRVEATRWVSGFSLPTDQVPGTDITSDCPRKGDLDIPIAGAVRLLGKWHTELGGGSENLETPFNRALSRLKHWGGPPRKGPFAEPESSEDPDVFDCLGYPIVESENHILVQEASRHVINRWLSQRGSLGGDAARFDNAQNGARDQLHRYLRLISQRDFYEYNSLPYTRYSVKALWLLQEHGDPDIATAARGLIHWTFAKHALASSLSREIRPYRRQPGEERYARAPWFGTSTISPAAQAILLVGNLQHSADAASFDLSTPEGEAAYLDVTAHPTLGSLSDLFLADLFDVREASYVFPAALRGWLQGRFQEHHWQSFLQVFHHHEPAPLDSSLFLQPNAGVEIYSGNRNWTISAGGMEVPPGMPPDPEGGSMWAFVAAGAAALLGAAIGAYVAGVFGAIVGGVIGLVVGFIGGLLGSDAFASAKQSSKLWEDQSGIQQPTTLIPTPLGLDRTQTLRFGGPSVPTLAREHNLNWPRLCVSDGFMCGFDMAMPSRPFPDNVLEPCPWQAHLPGHLEEFRRKNNLGCVVFAPLEVDDQWRVWTFDSAIFALNYADPPDKQRWIVAYVVDDPTKPGDRRVEVQWNIPGSEHDWYNVYAYPFQVREHVGRAEDGYALHRLSGDPDDEGKTHDGHVTMPIDEGGYLKSEFWLLHEACDPDPGIWFGDWADKDCNSDKLPALRINIAPQPKQPFACRFARSDIEPNGIAMQVGGDCAGTKHGLYVYAFTKGCGKGECPPEARSFGYAIVAPAEGWSFTEFREFILQTAPSTPPTGNVEVYKLRIPHAPPSAPHTLPPDHTVTFRWWWPGDKFRHTIVHDGGGSGALIAKLGSDTRMWPLASGSVTGPDGALQGPLLESSGNGCFVLNGRDLLPDPPATLVDLRPASLRVNEGTRASLANSCN